MFVIMEVPAQYKVYYDTDVGLWVIELNNFTTKDNMTTLAAMLQRSQVTCRNKKEANVYVDVFKWAKMNITAVPPHVWDLATGNGGAKPQVTRILTPLWPSANQQKVVTLRDAVTFAPSAVARGLTDPSIKSYLEDLYRTQKITMRAVPAEKDATDLTPEQATKAELLVQIADLQHDLEVANSAYKHLKTRNQLLSEAYTAWKTYCYELLKEADKNNELKLPPINTHPSAPIDFPHFDNLPEHIANPITPKRSRKFSETIRQPVKFGLTPAEYLAEYAVVTQTQENDDDDSYDQETFVFH